MIDVTFLYFEDCPSHDVALSRLREVLSEEGIDVDIEVIKVETDDQARSLQFVGSPTIRINGDDIIPHSDKESVGLACRAYVLEDGRISPLPSNEMIRTGLRRNIESASLNHKN